MTVHETEPREEKAAAGSLTEAAANAWRQEHDAAERAASQARRERQTRQRLEILEFLAMHLGLTNDTHEITWTTTDDTEYAVVDGLPFFTYSRQLRVSLKAPCCDGHLISHSIESLAHLGEFLAYPQRNHAHDFLDNSAHPNRPAPPRVSARLGDAPEPSLTEQFVHALVTLIRHELEQE